MHRRYSNPSPASSLGSRLRIRTPSPARGEGESRCVRERQHTKHIVVIGQGAAGPVRGAGGGGSSARAKISPSQITLIDKAAEPDAGGNTRWTPSYMRMAAVDRVEPSFVHDMLEATRFKGDEDYFATLAAQAPATVQWIAAHGVPFHQPVYYLAKGPPRIQPVGGGETIHRELTRAAREAGVGLPLRLRGGRSRRRMTARSRASASASATRCPPTPWCWPAAASRPTAT